MIALTFDEFQDDEKFPDDDEIELYIVKDRKKVLYIGISKDNVYNRWFSMPSSHMRFVQKYSGTLEGGVWVGQSSIGIEIQKNFPKSLKWKIQLWSLKDCLEFLKMDYVYEDHLYLYPHKCAWYDIKTVEPKMIRHFRPKFNVIYNGGV
mgnify:CR=1 FL=1